MYEGIVRIVRAAGGVEWLAGAVARAEFVAGGVSGADCVTEGAAGAEAELEGSESWTGAKVGTEPERVTGAAAGAKCAAGTGVVEAVDGAAEAWSEFLATAGTECGLGSARGCVAGEAAGTEYEPRTEAKFVAGAGAECEGAAVAEGMTAAGTRDECLTWPELVAGAKDGADCLAGAGDDFA